MLIARHRALGLAHSRNGSHQTLDPSFEVAPVDEIHHFENLRVEAKEQAMVSPHALAPDLAVASEPFGSPEGRGFPVRQPRRQHHGRPAHRAGQRPQCFGKLSELT